MELMFLPPDLPSHCPPQEEGNANGAFSDSENKSPGNSAGGVKKHGSVGPPSS